VLLGKARDFDKIIQIYASLTVCAFAREKCRISRAFWLKYEKNMDSANY
jgi:hypothetical protein